MSIGQLPFLQPKKLKKPSKTYKKRAVKVMAIKNITPGGAHAWVVTKHGLQRRELKHVPEKMLAEFKEAHASN